MLELTVPSNTTESLRQEHLRKFEMINYQMQSDREDKGLKTSFMTVEVGALGHSLPSSVSSLRRACSVVTKSSIQQLLHELA